LLIVTGLPATGKSTLASRLADVLDLPSMAKDTIKEALFEELGAGDAGWSRRLSSASFATMFALALRQVRQGHSLLLEGNFRPGEHEAAIIRIAPSRIAQVLCSVSDSTRRARLQRRARSRSRHPGHRDSAAAAPASTSAVTATPASGFLELPGPRLHYDGDGARRGDIVTLVAVLREWLRGQ